MAWGTNGILAIALGQVVFLYCTATNKTQEIRACFEPNNYVTSVAWRSGANQLAVGTFQAELQLWDIDRCAKLRSLRSHRARIGSLAWSSSDTLASGSLDAKILLNDVRASRYVVGVLAHHTEEVCGLAWSPDGNTLASGSNDNQLCLWNSVTMPRCSNRGHGAAVRALTWSPWERHLLASGGGAADGAIKLWSSLNGQLLRSVATGSQVCALAWSNTTRELVSAHGHHSAANTVTLWEYPSMTRVCDLTGHTARVLHLAISPNGMSMASAGADETLRFWDVFPSSRSSWMSPNPGKSGRFDLHSAVIR
ncbi:hypothetical protein BBP00_00004602 [Phytophthora kernoviae]|uniref:CDC20/Fizzy WD40 domain-containing protein n=1 Tax=Phytophthora kernoviae TaxID=325452 RepID=A0A3F2RRC5_9STRA|nr:hypothetical protein BBP00_00004602 [Phytophthora kernoviae]